MPDVGGETHFCDMYGAYERLSAALEGAHRRPARRAQPRLLAHAPARRGSDDRRAAAATTPPVDQPIVRTHPETGRKCLYLGDHAEYIVGMPYDEGRALIEELNALAVHPDLTYEHRWKPGELIVWDNRCVMHRATAYDPGDAGARDAPLHGAGRGARLAPHDHPPSRVWRMARFGDAAAVVTDMGCQLLRFAAGRATGTAHPIERLYPRSHSMLRNIVTALIAGVLASCALSAAADDYPSRPIRIIVPFSPAAPSTGRSASSPTRWASAWDSGLHREQAGRGRDDRQRVVAKAAPDGYTLLLASQTNAISATLYSKLPYDPIDDFAPVSLIGREQACSPSIPACR